MWNTVEKHLPELLRSGLIGLVGLEAVQECLIEMLEGGLGLSGKFFGVRCVFMTSRETSKARKKSSENGPWATSLSFLCIVLVRCWRALGPCKHVSKTPQLGSQNQVYRPEILTHLSYVVVRTLTK